MSRWHKRMMKQTSQICVFNTFPFGLGCSGVANGSLVNGVLLMEKTHDTRSQILGSDLQILRVYICNTHGKCACDGLLRCTVLMPLIVVDRVSLVTFNTKITNGGSDRDLGT